MTSDSGHWNWTNYASHSYDSNGCKYSTTYTTGLNQFNTCDVELPSDFEVEFTYVNGYAYSIDVIAGGLGITRGHNEGGAWYYYRTEGDSSHDTYSDWISESFSSGDIFKVKRENGVLTAYHNNTLRKTLTEPSQFNYLVLQTFDNGRWTQIKNVKIKSL